ncbi:hypothetical protein CSC33_1875 [Pseudomonas aeruginosa]|nr:hypothetical protein CSC33_1875 [Pseudomonas aeruginosa]
MNPRQAIRGPQCKKPTRWWALCNGALVLQLVPVSMSGVKIS